MAKHVAPYRTYVVRCWQEHSSQTSPRIYQFSLEVPATGERFKFTHSEELINTLKLAISQVQVWKFSDATPENEPG